MALELIYGLNLILFGNSSKNTQDLFFVYVHYVNAAIFYARSFY
jgi:hypothetical protein